MYKKFLCIPLIAIGLLAGCASYETRSAAPARIESGTSPELREARDKLAAARSAVVRKDMLQAERLAQESRVAAELAFAKAEADKAAAINADMRTSIDALKVEMQRNAGDPQ